MTTFSVGDIARIVSQPDDISKKIVGELGYISELSSTHALFTALKMDGSFSGYKIVNINCLELETSPHWGRAREIRDKILKRMQDEDMENEARMIEVSEKYGISVDRAKAINQFINELSTRSWWPK
jgi:hypothetical protein